MLPSNATGEMAPLLWWLDAKTGRWRQMGEMKPVNNSRIKRSLGGRRFYIGDIQTDKISQIINIDIPWKRCYVRAQAFTMTNKGLQPVEGATVTLIGKENTDQEQYYGFTKAVTNKNGIACVPAWCDSNVVLQSNKYKLTYNTDGSERVSQLHPDNAVLEKLSAGLEASVVEGNELSSFQFAAKVISQAGPIFGSDEINKCLDLSDTLVAFRFHLNETKIELNELDDFGSRPPGHPLSWYTTDASKPNQEPKKCFLKILTFYDKPMHEAPMVSVQSYTPDLKTRYGFSLKNQAPTGVPVQFRNKMRYLDRLPEMASACVEYRCSEMGKETLIVVTLLTGDHMHIVVAPPLSPSFDKRFNINFNQLLINTLNISYGTILRAFYAPVNISDRKVGLYSGPGMIAEERCKAGAVVYVEEDVQKRDFEYAVLGTWVPPGLGC